MFGELFEPTAYGYTVQEGVYTVTIKDIMPKTVGGYNALEITIDIDGQPGANPRYWTMFDAPANQDYLKSWRQKMTKFCDAFEIPTDHPLNPAEWLGHSGKVYIGKSKKTGYMEVQGAVVEGAPKTIPVPESTDPGF